MSQPKDGAGEDQQRPSWSKQAARHFITSMLLDIASKIFFTIAGLVLLLFSATLVGMAIYRLYQGYFTSERLLFQTLESISLVVISIAVFDLSKFLIEEEVVRERELRSLSEARMSLTKFFTIIILAILLESIVVVFESKFDDVSDLLYPTALMGVGVFALIGLGIFQLLTAKARTIDPTSDRTSPPPAHRDGSPGSPPH
jgi:hypothetical protein